MITFVVYADYALGGRASADERARVADALPGAEPCVWVDGDKPRLLRACFNVDADDLVEAISVARGVLEPALALAGLQGAARKVTAMSEQEQATWTPDVDSGQVPMLDARRSRRFMTDADLPPRPNGKAREEHFVWLGTVAPLFIGLTRSEAYDLATRLRVELSFRVRVQDGARMAGVLVPEADIIWLNMGDDGRVARAAGDSWPLRLSQLPIE